MEVRESSGPRAAGAPSMQAGPGSFGAYYHRGASFPPGAPLMASPPSGIHAPAAMRHTPPPQPIAVAAPPAAPNSPPSFPPDDATPMISQQMGVSQAPPMGVGMGMSMGMGMGIGMGMPRTEPVKRKRGRPRKYGTDVNGVALGLAPISSGTGTPREKKARSSGKKAQLNALGAAGQSFTPHVITVAAGEDVAMKIMSFSQRGPWAICILSANGAISNVTLRQPSISGGSVTYEGRFEILSLSGSFLLTESGGTRSRTGGLSVSLAGPDGRVVGGGVAGLLMAASPVQVVVGTFLPESRKSQQARAGVSDIPPGMHNTGTATGTSPLGPMAQPARADASGSLHDHRSRSLGGDIQQQAHVAHVMPLQSMDWTGAQFNPEARVGTDNMGSSPGGS